jgi:hypothetical protein
MTPEQQQFLRTIDALSIANPYCLAASGATSLARCVEASTCGAQALRELGYEAFAIPSAIVGVNEVAGRIATVGLGARAVYDRFNSDDDPFEPFETWRGKNTLPDDDEATHMVIEVRSGGLRALVDLTYGQLRRGHGIPVELSLKYLGGAWPSQRLDDWVLEHIESPHSEAITKRTATYKNKGLVRELRSAMDIAFRSGLSVAAFYDALKASDPRFPALYVRIRSFM